MKILVTAEHDQSVLEELYQHADIQLAGWATKLKKLGEVELIAVLKDADILLTSYDEVTRRVIENSANLKLIVCTRANPVNIDIQAANEKNIPVVYTPGRNSDCTAEYTIAMLLGIARKIPMAYQELKKGNFLAKSAQEKQTQEGLEEDVTWALDADSPYVLFKGTQLKNKTLGLIGYGNIGKRVAKVAQALGMYLLIYDPFVPEIEVEEPGVSKATLQEVLSNSDFVTCHCKVTAETRALIGKEQLRLMKKTAYLINTSRGAIVNEQDVIEALRNKEIAGAALDVFASEPLTQDHPFITELDNVLITPHLAGATLDAITNHTRMAVADIQRFIKGEALLYQYK